MSIESTDTKVLSLKDYPLSLTVEDIAKIMGISRANAYNLCHREGFPCVQIGKRLVVPRAAFEKWMENPHVYESEVRKHG